jgi:hypothetical protein
MNKIKELRDAAMTCSNVDYRQVLKDCADRLDEAWATLMACQEDEYLSDVIGLSSHAKYLLENLPPEADPSPLGGDTTPALMRMVA